MRTSDVSTLISVFLFLFAALVIAYGLGLLFDKIQEALVFGFGVAILIAASYFWKRGKNQRSEENLDQLKKLGNNK